MHFLACPALPDHAGISGIELPPLMSAYYAIQAQSSRRVGITAEGQLVAAHDAAHPATLINHSSHPTLAVVIVEQPTPIKIEGGTFTERVQPWRVKTVEGGVILYEPTYDHILVEEESGVLHLTPPDNPPGGAIFQLVALPDRDISRTARQTAEALAQLLPANMNGPDMLDVIIRSLTPENAPVLQAVLRLLPRDQIDWLGVTILGLPEHLSRLAAAFPKDIWTNVSLPILREWLATRGGIQMAQLPPKWDFLAKRGLDGRPTSIGQWLNASARAGIPPRRTVCIVATARNEGPYLIEWIAYHRAIGAEAIFLYSNDNSDGSDELLRALALAGEITWIDNHVNVGMSAQAKAYGHAFGVLPQVLEYRWTLVIDLDEFFAFDANRHRSLPDFIQWQETRRADVIALNWLMFGSNGHAIWTDQPLQQRFTRRLPWIDAHVKCLSRTNICQHSRPHHPTTDWLRNRVFLDSDGDFHAYQVDPSISLAPKADRAWIAHYFLKSAEEFIWKFSRNRGDYPLVREPDPGNIDRDFASVFFNQHISPALPEDARILACAPGLAQEMARIMALPGVASARAAITRNYRESVDRLLDSIQANPAFADPACLQASLLRLARE